MFSQATRGSASKLAYLRVARKVAMITVRKSGVAAKAMRLQYGCPWRCVASTAERCAASKSATVRIA
jgi:hypothetical protein